MANLLSTGTAFAGLFGPDAILGQNGAPAPTTAVTVYQSDGTTLATLYTSQTKVTTASNPVNTDNYGNLTFYTDPGIYVLSFIVGGVASTKTVEVGPWYTDGAWNVYAETAAVTANSGDSVLANASSAAFAVTTPAPVVGARLLVTKTDSSANAVSITTPTGVIDGPTGITGIGTATIQLGTQGESAEIHCDGTNWHVVGSAGASLASFLTPVSPPSSYTLNAFEFAKMTGTTTATVPVTAGVATAVQNAGTGTITVQPASGTINAVGNWGATSITLTAQGQAVFLVGDGTNVNVVAQEASPPANALTLISAQVLSAAAATVTFTSIPASYNHLLFKVMGASSASAEVDNFKVVINGDTAAHYDIAELKAANGSAIAYNEGAQSFIDGGSTQLYLPGSTATAGSAGFYEFEFPDYAQTTFRKLVRFSGGFNDYTTSTSDTSYIAGLALWRSTSAITSLTLTLASGSNFVAKSAFYLYGVS